MQSSFVLQDQASLSDLQGFLTRAKRLDQEGAVRLKSYGATMTVTVAPIYGTSIISNDPTVLGMRVIELSQATSIDAVVSIAAVQERLATANLEVSLPPTREVVPWAGVSAPQSNWEFLGELTESEVSEANKQGVAEVAAAIPENLGAQLVQKIRSEVWGKPFSEFNLPRGVAFAAIGLGFVSKGDNLKVYVSGNWKRITSPYGHVLVKN